MPTLLVNGQPHAKVDALDRALQYGDGLFETIACRRGIPELWAAHMDRLRRGCERLGIAVPDAARLRQELALVAVAGGPCVVKIIVSRGNGGRGYRPAAGDPNRIVAVFPWPDYPAQWATEGVDVRVCRTPASLNPALAGLKHLNRLENVLARSEWDDPAIAEGLLCDPLARVVEGTMSNLFLVRRGKLLTPDLAAAGVAGVMRGVLLALARDAGIAVEERTVVPAELTAADEAFLCNSLIRIWPIRAVEGHRLPDARPHTARLRQLLAEYIKEADGVEDPVL